MTIQVCACVCVCTRAHTHTNPCVRVREIKRTLSLCDISLWFHREFKFTVKGRQKKVRRSDDKGELKVEWRAGGEDKDKEGVGER